MGIERRENTNDLAEYRPTITGKEIGTLEIRRHIPNALTFARLIGAAVFIVVLSLWSPSYPESSETSLLLAAAIFVIAVMTDALDGYLARKWQVVSLLGRVMDPLADKIIVLGGFVMLASPTFVVVIEIGRASCRERV